MPQKICQARLWDPHINRLGHLHFLPVGLKMEVSVVTDDTLMHMHTDKKSVAPAGSRKDLGQSQAESSQSWQASRDDGPTTQDHHVSESDCIDHDWEVPEVSIGPEPSGNTANSRTLVNDKPGARSASPSSSTHKNGDVSDRTSTPLIAVQDQMSEIRAETEDTKLASPSSGGIEINFGPDPVIDTNWENRLSFQDKTEPTKNGLEDPVHREEKNLPIPGMQELRSTTQPVLNDDKEALTSSYTTLDGNRSPAENDPLKKLIRPSTVPKISSALSHLPPQPSVTESKESVSIVEQHQNTDNNEANSIDSTETVNGKPKPIPDHQNTQPDEGLEVVPMPAEDPPLDIAQKPHPFADLEVVTPPTNMESSDLELAINLQSHLNEQFKSSSLQTLKAAAEKEKRRSFRSAFKGLKGLSFGRDSQNSSGLKGEKQTRSKLFDLANAAESGDLQSLKRCLEAFDPSEDVNAPYNLIGEVSKKNAFMRAATRGFVQCLEAFTKHNLNVLLTDDFGRSALHAALKAGQSEAAQWILFHSLQQEHVDSSRSFQDQRSRPRLATIADEKGTQPIHLAACIHETTTLQLLLDAGAELNSRDSSGCTPLVYATRTGSLPLVEFILNRAADVNTQDVNGQTPLMIASRLGHMASAQALLDAGADRHRRDRRENCAIHVAAEYGHLNILELLYLATEDTELENEYGERPLHLAAYNNQNIVVKALLSVPNCFVNVWTKSRAKQVASPTNLLEASAHFASTPLHYACRGNAFQAAYSLLENGALVNGTQENSASPLILACEANSQANNNSLPKLLLQKGANPNAALAEDAMTPLHIACRKNNAPLAKLLMDFGANSMAKMTNRHQDTPARYAKRKNSQTEQGAANAVLYRIAQVYKLRSTSMRPNPGTASTTTTSSAISNTTNATTISTDIDHEALAAAARALAEAHEQALKRARRPSTARSTTVPPTVGSVPIARDPDRLSLYPVELPGPEPDRGRDDPLVQRLLELGFPRESIVKALEMHNYQFDRVSFFNLRFLTLPEIRISSWRASLSLGFVDLSADVTFRLLSILYLWCS